MIKSSHKYERLGVRFGRVVTVSLIIIGLSLLTVGFILSAGSKKLLTGGLVIVGDPVVVLSFDRSLERLTALRIPKTAYIEATRGYGNYSLESIWKLGEIDKTGGALLNESLSQSLGLPLYWYIEDLNPVKGAGETTQGSLKRLFSPLVLFKLLVGKSRTNLPISQAFSLSRAFFGLKQGQLRVVDLDKTSVLVPENLPDGTLIGSIDPQRFDEVTNGIFENNQIRKEALSVAIFNTTGVATLGLRAGRILSHLGASVVFIGNDTPHLEKCEVGYQNLASGSQTLKLIQEIFHCRGNTEINPARSDIEMRIGADYAKIFSKKQN